MKLETKQIQGAWQEYILTNKHGMSVSVLNYGGIITKILVPDRSGKLENVVLGYKDYSDYKTNPHYFGAVIGRVAGRIQGAAFQLNNRTYQLTSNDGDHHLHGGPDGLHQVLWRVESFQTADAAGLTLFYTSIDGEGGYPGNAEIKLIYTLDNKNQLSLHYQASCDQATPFALTNHTYFNLNGDLKKTVDRHRVTIDSSKFAELDAKLIPTGKLIDVSGSSFDFRGDRQLGEGFHEDTVQNKFAGSGYDHYFIFDDTKNVQSVVEDPDSGRTLSIKTNQPGLVLYTSNGLSDDLPLAEAKSRKHLGVCFETQSSPASLHHEGFPDVILQPGEIYSKETIFTFGTTS